MGNEEREIPTLIQHREFELALKLLGFENRRLGSKLIWGPTNLPVFYYAMPDESLRAYHIMNELIIDTGLDNPVIYEGKYSPEAIKEALEIIGNHENGS